MQQQRARDAEHPARACGDAGGMLTSPGAEAAGEPRWDLPILSSALSPSALTRRTEIDRGNPSSSLQPHARDPIPTD